IAKRVQGRDRLLRDVCLREREARPKVFELFPPIALWWRADRFLTIRLVPIRTMSGRIRILKGIVTHIFITVLAVISTGIWRKPPPGRRIEDSRAVVIEAGSVLLLLFEVELVLGCEALALASCRIAQASAIGAVGHVRRSVGHAAIGISHEC